MTAVLTDFDPYQQWLNVAPGSRPPGPYQILGLQPLESDIALIRLAYDRQDLALSRVVLNETDRSVWNAVRRELDVAYAMLIDPERKAVLDAALRRKNGVSTALKSPRGIDLTEQSPAAASNMDGVSCRHCQRLNPTGRQFCGGCGQPLWDKCPRCGGQCAAEERFCGACGAEVAASWEGERIRCETQIEQGLALAGKHLYDAAIKALREVAKATDQRLEPYAARALLALDEIERQQATELTKARELLANAHEFLSVHSHEKAQLALEETPEPLRSPEHQDLLARSRACRKEILVLGGEIRTLIEEKRMADLAPKLERLLALKPNHTQGLEIAAQLRDRALKSAKIRLSRHEYREALDQLQQIPSTAVTEEVEKLRETAGELAAILAAVKNSALADPTLIRLAEKLCKIAPSSAEAAKLRDQLLERAKTKPASPRLRAPNWAIVPKHTFLEVPVDDLAHSTRAKAANDTVARALADQPGQFFTALGLALQGLEQSFITADLTPREKSSMLGKLAGIGLGRRQPTVAWGIDLDDVALKAVKLVRGPQDEFKIEAAEYIPHGKSLADAAADMMRSDVLAETVADFAKRAGDLKGVSVCVSIPGYRVLGRFCEIPPMPVKKVFDAVQYEARHQLPIELDGLCWSYAILDPVEGKAADEQPRQIMIQASRDNHLRSRVALFKDAGINVDCVQSDCVALHNAIVFEFSAGDDALAKGSGAIATLDFSASGANLVVSSPRHLWFRSFGSGSNEICRELARRDQLTFEQAQDVLRRPARARRYKDWAATVEPYLQQLASEVQRSLSNYRKASPTHPLLNVYGVGSSFPTLGLLRFLRTGK